MEECVSRKQDSPTMRFSLQASHLITVVKKGHINLKEIFVATKV